MPDLFKDNKMDVFLFVYLIVGEEVGEVSSSLMRLLAEVKMSVITRSLESNPF